MKPVLVVAAIISILGIPAGAYFVFSDRQIEVEYGTKTVCYKCKTVEKAPDKKIIWASKRHNYEVKIEESCCDKCKVTVESGTIVTCSKCGNEIDRAVREITVDPRERGKYTVNRETGTCGDCQGKPVAWGQGIVGSYYKYCKLCPHCGRQVPMEKQFTTCGDCGKRYKHVPSPPCPNCNGRGTWPCSACKGAGEKKNPCNICKGKGQYYWDLMDQWKSCTYCKGIGYHSFSCNGDGTGKNASCRRGKMQCFYCDGRGTIN